MTWQRLLCAGCSLCAEYQAVTQRSAARCPKALIPEIDHIPRCLHEVWVVGVLWVIPSQLQVFDQVQRMLVGQRRLRRSNWALNRRCQMAGKATERRDRHLDDLSVEPCSLPVDITDLTAEDSAGSAPSP